MSSPAVQPSICKGLEDVGALAGLSRLRAQTNRAEPGEGTELYRGRRRLDEVRSTIWVWLWPTATERRRGEDPLGLLSRAKSKNKMMSRVDRKRSISYPSISISTLIKHKFFFSFHYRLFNKKNRYTFF
jgi:hypothetical protein